MATKYHNFNIFMDEVVKTANQRVDLEKLFVLDNMSVLKIISIILVRGGGGWQIFVAIVTVLVLGPIAFGAVIGGFFLNPAGLFFAAIFGGAAVPTIYMLYQNRELPIAIKEVGEMFLPMWKRVEGDQVKVDDLLEQAVTSLIRKANLKQRKLFGLDD